MKSLIISFMVAIGLLGGTLGGYYYLMADHSQATLPPPTHAPWTPPMTQPDPPTADAPTSPAIPTPAATPAPTYVAPQYTSTYTYKPLPSDWASSGYTPPTTTQQPYQATPPTVKWQTQPPNNCIGASAVGC